MTNHSWKLFDIVLNPGYRTSHRQEVGNTGGQEVTNTGGCKIKGKF